MEDDIKKSLLNLANDNDRLRKRVKFLEDKIKSMKFSLENGNLNIVIHNLSDYEFTFNFMEQIIYGKKK